MVHWNLRHSESQEEHFIPIIGKVSKRYPHLLHKVILSNILCYLPSIIKTTTKYFIKDWE